MDHEEFFGILRLTYLAFQFNFIYNYVDEVWAINNPNFKNDIHEICPHELEVKETNESDKSAS